MKGLPVNLFEHVAYGDTSLGGISTKAKRFILTGEGIPPLFEPSKEHPEIKLVKRNISGKDFLHAEPVEKPTRVGWMSGGTFVWTPDGRFPNDYPISLHDRQETPEQYEQLSHWYEC